MEQFPQRSCSLLLVFLLMPSFDAINIADSSLLNGDGVVALVVDGYAALFFLDDLDCKFHRVYLAISFFSLPLHLETIVHTPPAKTRTTAPWKAS